MSGSTPLGRPQGPIRGTTSSAPTTRGHPETWLRWTCKSVRKLAEELNGLGHQVSYPVVAELLHELDYSLQANRKTKEGDSHPDRNAQFEYIDHRLS